MTPLSKSTVDLRPSPTIEDYLAVIYVMERDGEDIVAARLAESLEVSAPTVTVTLKRMERDGWLVFENKKGVVLTEAGLDAARTVIRRHMLTEWLLARMLKVPWSKVHSEAHQLEHSISKEIEQQMLTNLDNPQLCPHGNPLPGYEELSANWIPLTRMQVGDEIIIRRVHESAEDDSKLMEFLETNGIIPGAQACIRDILPFNQTLTLVLEGRPVILGYAAARYIEAEIYPK
jgi:DtxR family Mn-dependent transcriptional regulator